MIKKVLLLAGILAVFSTTKAHPATDNDTIEVVYADTTGIDIDSIEASIDHIELDEVTIEASAWVRKADRNLLFPNAQQIKQSKNGLQLLQKLQIPGIVINPTDNSISLTDKSELSLHINGRPVTEKEIQGISPEQIIRVEYIDNPGIRYGEAGAVLDFIIKTPTSGGSFMGNFTPSLNRGWGQYWTSVKVNTSKSEFSYSGWFAPRWNLEMGRSNTERYELADGSRYVRTEQSQKGSGFEAWHNGHTLNYNFLDPQKQTFNASLNFNNNNYKNKYKGILTDERPGGIENNMYDRTEYISLHPSLNLYYQNNLKKDQLIMANLVTSYETSHSHRLYNENDLATDAPMVNIDNLIKGKTFSVLGEVDYEKNLEKQPAYRRNTAHAVMDTKQVCRTKYHRSHESRQQLYFRRILVTPREPFRWVGRTRIQPLSLCATKQAVPHLLHLASPVHGPIYHRRLFLPTIQLCPHGQRNHPRHAQPGRSRHRRDSTIDR